MSELGSYSADDWAVIVKTVAPLTPALEKQLREQLTHAAATYIEDAFNQELRGSEKNSRDRWLTVEQRSRELTDAIAAAQADWPDDLDRDCFEDQVRTASQAVFILNATARELSANWDRLVKQRLKSRNPARQRLIAAVLDAWIITLQRPLQFSNQDGKANGPLIRFCTASLKPILGKNTPGGAGLAKIIDARRSKPRAKRQKKATAAKRYAAKSDIDGKIAS